MQDLGKEIEQALDILEAVYKQSQNKKKLILDKGKIVYLQVVLFKTPFSGPRKRRFLRLRHSLYGDDPDICLFVPNRKTGVEYKKTTDELIDFCVDHYTGILEKHKIKGITTVMPLKQLKSEYGTYELRRKLVRRFDLFLCKNSLLYNSRFLTALGKIFRVANKEPLGVHFPKEDVEYDPEFQKNIEKAIFTSSFYISRFSDNYSIPFGCLSNTKTVLRENLQEVLSQIFKEKIIPGGVRNIRAMYLWPSQSKPIPLYISSELPVDLKKPFVRSNKKRPRGVSGELSTQPKKKVFVTPSGEVFVTEDDKDFIEADVNQVEDEDSFVDESNDDDDGDGDGDNGGHKKGSLKSKDAVPGDEEESESENDEEIEKKETRLLEIKRLTESDSYPKGKSAQNGKQQKENDTSANKKQKVKPGQKGANEFNVEKMSLSEVKKSEKTREKKRKANKTERKMLIKQKKFKLTEGPGRKKTKRKNN